MVKCKRCKQPVKYDLLKGQWLGGGPADLQQYCQVDMDLGSKLHEPEETELVKACLSWAASSDDKFLVPEDLSTSFWLDCQLWVTMSMRDNHWLETQMRKYHPNGINYHPTHDEQIHAAMAAEFDVCLAGNGMLQLRRSK